MEQQKKRVETASVLPLGPVGQDGTPTPLKGGFDDTSPPADSFMLPFSYSSPYHDFMSCWRATNDDVGFVSEYKLHRCVQCGYGHAIYFPLQPTSPSCPAATPAWPTGGTGGS